MEEEWSLTPPEENEEWSTTPPEKESVKKQPIDTPYDPSNPSKGKALIDRIPAAQREVLRSIGTGEDAADAYMRGLNNPSLSDTMQTEAIQKYYKQFPLDDMSKSKNPYLSAAKNTAIEIGGLGASAAGLATDIATNPKELLMIATMAKLPTLFRQINPELSKKIADFATKERTLGSVAKDTGAAIKGALTPKLKKPGIGDVEDMRIELAQSAQDASSLIAQNKRVDIANLDSKYATISNGLDTKLKVLDGKIELSPEEISKGVTNIPTVADKSTTTLRRKYWDYAKDLSNRFGAEWEKAIAGEKIPTNKLNDALVSAIERDGFLAKPKEQWSNSQKAIYEYQQKINSQLPGVASQPEYVMTQAGPVSKMKKTGTETLELSKVDRELQSILNYKKGKEYGQGDHILSLTRQSTAEAIGDTSSKIKAVRMKFAPELQTKHELNKIVQPFNKSGDKDTTAGIKFFSEYAQGKMTDPDKLRVLRDIQSNKFLGKDIINPLDDMKLKRNTILRNQVNLEIEKPTAYQRVQEKYTALADTLRKDVRMQNEVTKAMMEDAIQSQNIADRIKKAAIGTGALAGVGGGAKKLGLLE